MIFFLFGEMGSGKNYVGEKLAKELGYKFLDGDDLLPQNLKDKVKDFKSLTLDEVEDFVKNHLIPGIKAEGGNLVVAQALYRANHRAYMTGYFGPDKIVWIHVKPPFISHMRRLLSRDNGFKWAALMLASKPFFQNSLYLKQAPDLRCWEFILKNTDNVDLNPLLDKLRYYWFEE